MKGLFTGRNVIPYAYSCYGYTRGGGKVWHGGQDIVGEDNDVIHFPYYTYDDGTQKAISGIVRQARIVTNKNNRTWEWGYYVSVQLDASQTPDAVNWLYFCHCSTLLVKVGQKVISGQPIAIMGNTGNAALNNPPYKHCHFEVRATATSKGLDPTAYSSLPNSVCSVNMLGESSSNYLETLIDVSKHQGKINWTKIPYRAIVRVGYRGYGNGQLMRDERFEENITGALQNNKLFGFYFFSQAITTAEATLEAEYAVGLINTLTSGRGYPLFFDAEWSHNVHDGRADKISKTQRTACARAFCKRAAELGMIAGVYTFTSFVGTHIDYEDLCKDYVGWLADYRANYDRALPRHIHQYTSSGVVAGIIGHVDMNHLLKALPGAKDEEKEEEKPVSGKLQKPVISGASVEDVEAFRELADKLSISFETTCTVSFQAVSQGDADQILALSKKLKLKYTSSWV